MKKIILTFLAITASVSAYTADWTFTPKLYVRGGFTQSTDLRAKGDGFDSNGSTPFNAQSYNQTNAFQPNLTEFDLYADIKDKARIVYGVNIDKNERFELNGAANNDHNGLPKERQAYIEFYNAIGKDGTLWFGRRPYRGFGDLMDGTFPLDERNLFGGGVMLDKVGIGRWEVAYAVNEDPNTPNTNDVFTTNMLLNKYIIGIDDGNITFNGEVHQNNSLKDEYKSYGYMIGGQYARWNMSIFDSKLYNIFVLNYSHGHLGDVEAGEMASAFDSKKKNEQAQRFTFKIGGDLKNKAWATYYTIKYQNHMGDKQDANGYTQRGQNWQFTDFMLRPMYALTSHVGVGIDGFARLIMRDTTVDSPSSWAKDQDVWRLAAVASYHLDPGAENIFQTAEVSVLAGRIHHDKETTYFKGHKASKDADFIRFKYTMQI